MQDLIDMPSMAGRPPEEIATGRRMLYWLAQAAKRARGDERREVVAALADQSKEIIKRFEDAVNWPQKLDQVVAAYAQVGGLEDGRQLWQEALDLWWAHGSKPLTGRRDEATRPSQRVAAEVERTARRQARRETRNESERTPTSTRKRRAAP
jgi:hypothetical protein